jgi:hypothetical protein
MFNLFKKQTPLERLEKSHKSLMEEAFKLSKIDRTKSDEKYAEAEEVAKQIGELQREAE